MASLTDATGPGGGVVVIGTSCPCSPMKGPPVSSHTNLKHTLHLTSRPALLLSFLAHGPKPKRAVWQRAFPVCFVAVLCVQSSSLPMRVAPTGALPSPSLWLVMLRDTQTEKPTGTFLSPDYAALPPHLVDVPWSTWHGEFMSARAVSKYTQKLIGGVGAVLLTFFHPDDRRIMMFDPDDEWWRRVEARRGHHGPHGQSRRHSTLAAPRSAYAPGQRSM